MDNISSKTLGSTFLYRKYANYDKLLFDFIMTAEHVDPAKEGFEDIMYDVKKYQSSSVLSKLMKNPNVMLMIPNKQLPRALKVFAAKDVKSDSKLKVFVDCSGIIYESDGEYICDNVGALTSHLVDAMTTLLYYRDPKIYAMNSGVLQEGASIFAKLFTNVVNYIYRINSVSSARDKCMYISSIYFMSNILGRSEDEEGIQNIARKISGLSTRETEILKMQFDKMSFNNLKYFIETVSDILKLDKLTVDVVVEKWMFLYGVGTPFALELYPAFSAMITDAYMGAYLNNQKTIEKVINREMNIFATNYALKIGADVL